MQLRYQQQMQLTMQQQLRAQQALMQAQLRAAQAQVQQYQEQVNLLLYVSLRCLTSAPHCFHACMRLLQSRLSINGQAVSVCVADPVLTPEACLMSSGITVQDPSQPSTAEGSAGVRGPQAC